MTDKPTEKQLKRPTKELNKNGKPQGMHPNSQKNLDKRKSWQSGQSGNPRGRPMTACLDSELERIPSVVEDGFDGKDKTNLEWMIRSQVRDARTGDNAARKEIWERKEGKVTQPITGGEGEPLIPYALNLIFPEGTEIKSGRMSGNGHEPVEVDAGGDGHKATT